MKRYGFLLTLVLCLAAVTAGCSSGRSEAPVVYSSLQEKSVRMDLDSLLRSAGILDRNRALLFDCVERFNSSAPREQMTEGFTPIAEAESPGKEALSLKAVPGDYNSRITAFALLEEGFLEIPEDAEILEDRYLREDLEALELDPSADVDQQAFRAFFSGVPAGRGAGPRAFSRAIAGSWEDRGIRFPEHPEVKLLCLVVPAEQEDGILLQIRHAALLLKTPDRTWWLLEKLDFRQPYRVVVVSDPEQAAAYLLGELQEEPRKTRPFVMMNDRLMPGR